MLKALITPIFSPAFLNLPFALKGLGAGTFGVTGTMGTGVGVFFLFKLKAPTRLLIFLPAFLNLPFALKGLGAGTFGVTGTMGSDTMGIGAGTVFSFLIRLFLFLFMIF